MPEEKSGKTEKREAEEPLIKETSIKKQKVTYVEKVNAPPSEDKSTSTEEDTYTESEEEENVASKVIGKEGNNEEEVDSFDKSCDRTIIEPRRATPSWKSQNKQGGATIWVANLPSKIDEVDLLSLKRREGEVTEVRLARFGHVDFATKEAAEKALEMKKFMGCKLKLEMAKQKLSSTPNSRKCNSSEPTGEVKPESSVGNRNGGGLATIFAGNLSFNADEDDICAFFKEAGEVIDVRLARFGDGRTKGICHVDFATEGAAKKALEMNQQEFMGRAVRVDLAHPKISSTHSRTNFCYPVAQ